MMKKNLTVLEMMDDASPYFCGSAALLSLNHKLNIVSGDTIGLEDNISDMKKEISYLARQDAILFSITSKSDKEEIDYDSAIEILESYGRLLERLSELLSALKASNKMELFQWIKLDFDFLMTTILDSSSVLLEREECPSAYKRVIHDLSFCDRKEW